MYADNKKDESLRLLFDVNGYIAGVQAKVNLEYCVGPYLKVGPYLISANNVRTVGSCLSCSTKYEL